MKYISGMYIIVYIGEIIGKAGLPFVVLAQLRYAMLKVSDFI
jgi:hypothetical protein